MVSTEEFEALKAKVEELEAAVAVLQRGSVGAKRKAPPPAEEDGPSSEQVGKGAGSTALVVKKKLSGGPPRGRPPKDKTWDYEKQEWVASGSAPAPKKPVASPKPKILLESGGYKRPVGRPPAGKVWDTASGEYVQQSEQLAIK